MKTAPDAKEKVGKFRGVNAGGHRDEKLGPPAVFFAFVGRRWFNANG